MSRRKILWLCSWYPNKLEPFDGDFIQRHARAAAIYNDIHVIFVVGDATGKVTGAETQINKFDCLTEELIYYKRSASFFGKIFSHYRWLQLFRNAIKKYISLKGKPDIIHVHIPFKAGLLALWIKRKYKVPYLVTEHWGIYNDIEKENYNNRSAFFKRLSKKIFLNASAFISVSRFVAEGVNKLVISRAYDIIPNAVDTELFYFKELNRSSVFRFIHVSNMAALKNVEGIIRSFSLLLQKGENAELVIAGNKDGSLKDIATGLGLTGKNISFCGEVPYEKVAFEMQLANCFILFSNIENSPCVIGESLCCGLPVIATNVGGVPELTDDSNSIIVEPKNENGLAAAMMAMIEKQGEFDHKKIAEDAKGKFSYSVIGKKLDGIYSNINSSEN